tara:strand:- start:701 stop:1444 length:744 start_codon:yes stop_codon:yes gene_type:complete
MIVLVYIILILAIIYIYHISEQKKRNYFKCPKLKIIQFHKSNYPNIVIIAGTHGDEYAPPIGIEKFIKQNGQNFKRGNLIFIPRVNKIGLKKKTRYLPCKSNFLNDYDINRNYGIHSQNSIENQIINIISKADLVIDFHEGYDFNIINKESIGSSFSISDTHPEVITIANGLKNHINSFINHPQKKFTLLINDDNPKHSLSYYSNKNKIPYILVELTGKYNKQPLNLRINQTYLILKKLFNDYHIMD